MVALLAVIQDTRLASLLSHFHGRLADGAGKAECELLLLRALTHLVVRHAEPYASPRPAGKERPAIKKACEYMEADFADDISLSRLANLVSLSPYYLVRAFERQTGIPPHAYFEAVRVRKAREFLDLGETLVSAALGAGYSDQSHLTHRFKRFLGITPGQYVRARRIAVGKRKVEQDRLVGFPQAVAVLEREP